MAGRLITAGALVASLVLGGSLFCQALVPPPPVNQTIGIDDGVFNDLTEGDCRVCHSSSPPPEIPVNTAFTNADRHHLRVGTLIPDGTLLEFPADPATPNPTKRDSDLDGIADSNYDCLNCHDLVGSVFTAFRDCLACHQQIPGQASVHHLTPLAQGGSCTPCHGSLVQDRGDGHRIPPYAPSLVTPWPSGKPNAGPGGEGNCSFCHNNRRPPLPGGTPDKRPTIDPASGVPVYRNAETHHNTGLTLQANRCVWCHNILPGLNNAFSIRTCQGCHGIESLHNIQTDSDNPANPGVVVVGGENFGYGHIGSNADCQGCHGFSLTAQASPTLARAIIPDLKALSTTAIYRGTAAEITLSGSNFVNTVTDPASGRVATLESLVVVTDAHGYQRTLQPLGISHDTLEVTLPADLGTGTYRVQAVKEGRPSNPMVITVVPRTEILSAQLAGDGTITLKGAGFGDPPPAAENLGVFVNGAGVRVESWEDTQIIAHSAVAKKGQTLTLVSAFGSVSSELKTPERNGNRTRKTSTKASHGSRSTRP